MTERERERKKKKRIKDSDRDKVRERGEREGRHRWSKGIRENEKWETRYGKKMRETEW